MRKDPQIRGAQPFSLEFYADGPPQSPFQSADPFINLVPLHLKHNQSLQDDSRPLSVNAERLKVVNIRATDHLTSLKKIFKDIY